MSAVEAEGIGESGVESSEWVRNWASYCQNQTQWVPEEICDANV